MFNRISAASVTPFGERQKRRIVFVVVVVFAILRIALIFVPGLMKIATMADSSSYVHLAAPRKANLRTRYRSVQATTS